MADKPPKYTTKEPIAALEKRVIDSPAFAALPPSAVVILLLLARNLDKGRNGHILLAPEDAERHGIDSKTMYRQMKILAAAGFIFQTKRGGYGNCARHALTWLPLSKDLKGLHVDNFKPCAWRNWTPPKKKKGKGKMSSPLGQNSRSIAPRVDKFPVLVGDKIPYVEVNTNSNTGNPSIRVNPGPPLAGKHEGAPQNPSRFSKADSAALRAIGKRLSTINGAEYQPMMIEVITGAVPAEAMP